MISEAHRIYEEAHDRADAATQRRMLAEAELARARTDEQAAFDVLGIWAPVSMADIHAGCTNENDSAPGCATAWLRDHPAEICRCQHSRHQHYRDGSEQGGGCNGVAIGDAPARCRCKGYADVAMALAGHTAAAVDKLTGGA